MTDLHFYNRLTRRKEKFTPIDAKNVRVYVCGPTVYDNAHIGNARPIIVFDVLYRLLRAAYGKSHVRYVRNITDVDDKINARAARDYPDLPLNAAIAELTKQTEAQFHADAAALNCLKPDAEPRATQYIEEMKKLIERLAQNGHAYVAEDHVLFSVPAMNKTAKERGNPPYGRLSGRPLKEMLAGARVEVADYKRDSQDFVLWKPSEAGEPGWASPCGIGVLGRPGWHIECSAMSMAELLEPFGGGLNCDDSSKNCFDIHGGGLDLIFPHHENEIAQSCCALGGAKMAKFWLHNGFVQVEGRKMSKSAGNFITIRQVLETPLPQTAHLGKTAEDKKLAEQWAGLAARFSMLQTHYREPLNWTQKRLRESSTELYRWYELLRRGKSGKKRGKMPQAVESALADDMNFPAAITVLRQFYKEGEGEALRESMEFLGLSAPRFMAADCPLFARGRGSGMAGITDINEAEIEAQIAKRAAFIAAANWGEADKIRNALLEKGVKLQDSADKKTGKRSVKWEWA